MIRILMSADEVIEIEAIGKIKQRMELTNNEGAILVKLIN